MNAVLHCAAPPTDGTPFLAEGRVVIEDAAGLSVIPVVGRMQFSEAGELVWYLGRLSVRTYADAVVHLDCWHAAPPAGGTFAWVTDPRTATYDDGGDW